MAAVSGRGTVAVGLNGSPEAVGAAQWAVEAAHLRHLDALVVCAYQIPTTPGLTGESIAASRHAADQIVSGALSELTIPPTFDEGGCVGSSWPHRSCCCAGCPRLRLSS